MPLETKTEIHRRQSLQIDAKTINLLIFEYAQQTNILDRDFTFDEVGFDFNPDGTCDVSAHHEDVGEWK